MEPILRIKNLSVEIKQRILANNVSFDINEGEVVLLSGANGMGKSTILKSIMRLETEGKRFSGEILYSGFGDLLKLNGNDLQKFRSSIAYIQQKDDYAEMGNIQVRDIMSESDEVFENKCLSYAEVNELIDKWLPRRENGSRIFDAKSQPAKFSGGEQRLLSVLSVIATRPNAKLLIIDEPLNNLDFVNARNISNLINKVINENPKMGVLMISHCRIFPFITREIKLTSDGVIEPKELYTCHSCFGEPNEAGYYLY